MQLTTVDDDVIDLHPASVGSGLAVRLRTSDARRPGRRQTSSVAEPASRYALMHGMVLWLCCILLVMAASTYPVAAQARRSACAIEPTRTGTVARLGPGLDLHLADGTVLVPLGLMPVDGVAAGAPPSGTPVRFQPMGEADRWGRIPARIEAADMIAPHPPSHWRWWEETLLLGGSAILKTERQADPCRSRLQAAEASARTEGRGLWAGAGWPLRAEEPQSVLGRVGQFGVVEGRVQSVGERRSMTYLNFGSDWSGDMTVSISRPVWTRLVASGIRPRTLTGARVLVRGLIRDAGGPLIELAQPDDIEILER